jgi:periplasmic protein TonB
MRESGVIADCLLDNDPEDSRNNSRRRGSALIISTAIEIATVAALLFWPILNPGVLGARFTFVPVPPYHAGGPGSPHPRRLDIPRPHGDSIDRGSSPPIFMPPRIPDSIAQIDDSAAGAQAPSIGNGSAIDGEPYGDPNIIGATGENPSTIAPPNPKPPNPVPAMLRKSEGVQQGLLDRRIEPSYPQMAILMRLSGTVKLEAIIEPDGSVGHVEVLSGHPILARAAIEAVQRWHYKPTLLNGQAVAVDTFITVNFTLNR